MDDVLKAIGTPSIFTDSEGSETLIGAELKRMQEAMGKKEEYVFQITYQGQTKSFPTHAALDTFCEDVIEFDIEPSMTEKYSQISQDEIQPIPKEYYMVLKCFDRTFWIRFFQIEIEVKQLITYIEEICSQKGHSTSLINCLEQLQKSLVVLTNLLQDQSSRR